MRELENRDRILKLSQSTTGRKTHFAIGLALFLWGCGLLFIFISGSRVLIPALTIPVILFACSLFLGGFIMRYLATTQVRGNTIFNFHSHLFSSLLFDLLTSIAFFNFSLLFIGAGIYASIGFGIIGGFFFILLLVGLFKMISDYTSKSRIAKRFDTSKIEIGSAPISAVGKTIFVEFQNSSPILEGVPLDFVLRYLKERHTKVPRKKGKETKSQFKTFVAIEKAQKVNLIDGKAAVEFQLSESESIPNNFDFKEPDYWELEVSDSKIGFFSRFVLDSI